MVASEADRHDLYTGLVEVIGETRADTLMTYLPTHAPSELATRSDLEALATRMDARFDRMDARFDRLFVTVVGGLFVIVAAMAGVVLSGM
jgi:hypothetical protein